MWSHLKWNETSLPQNYLRHLHGQELCQHDSAEPSYRRKTHSTRWLGGAGMPLAHKVHFSILSYRSLLLSLTQMLNSLQTLLYMTGKDKGVSKQLSLSYKGINEVILPDVGGWQSLMWVIKQNLVLRHYNFKHSIIWFVNPSSPSLTLLLCNHIIADYAKKANMLTVPKSFRYSHHPKKGHNLHILLGSTLKSPCQV